MELSEEEKKAIEELEDFIEDDEIQNISVFTAKKIKNIIEKQQKEIEELKQNRDEYKEEYIKLQNARYYNYISKDKIREWLDRFELEEELQDKYDEFLGSQAIYKFLKKLLEEK